MSSQCVDCKVYLASDHRCAYTEEASHYPEIRLLHRRGNRYLLRWQHFRRVQEQDVPQVLHPQSPRWNLRRPVCRRPQLGHNHYEGCDQLGQIRWRYRPTIRLHTNCLDSGQVSDTEYDAIRSLGRYLDLGRLCLRAQGAWRKK
jgi:hypothetical protein